MMDFFKKLDGARIFRLLLALGLAIYGIVEKDYFVLPLAIIFLLMGVFNISCCGAGGCSTGEPKTKEVYKGIIKPYKK